MSWRPEGWKNPIIPPYVLNVPGPIRYAFEDENQVKEYQAFEAGADAILEALRKECKFIDSRDWHLLDPDNKGGLRYKNII